MKERLLLSEQNPASGRNAIVADDGRACWLYLTAPNAVEPVADCWLYNATTSPRQRESQRGETPVVPLTHTEHSGSFEPPSQQSVIFRWSQDGNSVAVQFWNEVFGFIPRAGSGYSKLLSLAGPYGNPIDMELYSRVFDKAT